MIALRLAWVQQHHILPERKGSDVGDALLRTAVGRRAKLSPSALQRNAGAGVFYGARCFAAVEATDGAADEEREPDLLGRWEGLAGG